MASGGDDHAVRLWKLIRNPGVPLRVTVSHVMRGHKDSVTCVAASRTWSIVVSGSKDGSAIVWDLNRGTYVASIWHGDDERHEVHLVAISDSTVCLVHPRCGFHTLTTLEGKHRHMFPGKIAFAHRERPPDCSVAVAAYLYPPIHHFPSVPGAGVCGARNNCNRRVRWDNCPEDLECQRHTGRRKSGMEVPNLTRADR